MLFNVYLGAYFAQEIEFRCDTRINIGLIRVPEQRGDKAHMQYSTIKIIILGVAYVALDFLHVFCLMLRTALQSRHLHTTFTN